MEAEDREGEAAAPVEIMQGVLPQKPCHRQMRRRANPVPVFSRLVRGCCFFGRYVSCRVFHPSSNLFALTFIAAFAKIFPYAFQVDLQQEDHEKNLGYLAVDAAGYSALFLGRRAR